MLHLEIGSADILRAGYEIIHCDCPLARRRLLTILLKALGLPHGQIAGISHCHLNSVTNYIRRFSEGGLEDMLVDNRHGIARALRARRRTSAIPFPRSWSRILRMRPW